MDTEHSSVFIGSQRLRWARISRRRFTAGAAAASLAAAASGLVACSSSKNSPGSTTATAAPTAARSTPAPSSAAGDRPAAATRAAAATSPAPAAVLDSTKGKPGGTLVIQNPSYHGGLAIVTRNPTGAAQRIIGLVHSGLLAFNFGRPPSNGLTVAVEPDVAQALPEQPDPQTYTFTLKPGVKFQNGRDLTSQDVQYSLERLAASGSARLPFWTWLDSVQTPDAATAIVKSKTVYADGIFSLAQHADAFILAKEFEESPDSPNKLMGSGPFIFDSDQAPISTVVKKNPNYYIKPYPYYDQVTVLGNTDPAKQVADFAAHQVQLSYWQDENNRDQFKRARPDAKVWAYPFSANAAYLRSDQAPFNDKRVRQALSMALDRKAIRDATSKGEGEPDQTLSWANDPFWGFRKPQALGTAAKYWNFDVQSARQLLSAAGFDKPIESQMNHWDATVVGQAFVDSATLMQAQWKAAGIANIKDNTQVVSQFFSTTSIGDYDGMGFSPGFQYAVLGYYLKATFFSPPEGIKPPTSNRAHINDPQLSVLADKQLTQINASDRLQTVHAMEDLIAEGMYHIPLSTTSNTYFSDPSIQNIVVPIWAFTGSMHYVKYWWFA